MRCATAAVRRGRSAKETGEQYRRVGEQMLEYHCQLDRYLLLRFGVVLADPFAAVRQRYTFCQRKPVTPSKLRLKSKCVPGANQTYAPPSGQHNHHYWFDRASIRQFLDSTINQRPQAALSPEDRYQFEQSARPILEQVDFLASSTESRGAA